MGTGSGPPLAPRPGLRGLEIRRSVLFAPAVSTRFFVQTTKVNGFTVRYFPISSSRFAPVADRAASRNIVWLGPGNLVKLAGLRRRESRAAKGVGRLRAPSRKGVGGCVRCGSGCGQPALFSR